MCAPPHPGKRAAAGPGTHPKARRRSCLFRKRRRKRAAGGLEGREQIAPVEARHGQPVRRLHLHVGEDGLQPVETWNGALAGAAGTGCDPMAVMKEARLLPLGEYKGSAINLLLDLIASTTSLGNSACDVRNIPGDENSVSQTFIAINSRAVNDAADEEEIANRLLSHLLNARPAPGFSKPRYPGQNVLRTRKENMENGIPVDETVWQAILDLPDAPNSTSGSWL